MCARNVDDDLQDPLFRPRHRGMPCVALRTGPMAPNRRMEQRRTTKGGHKAGGYSVQNCTWTPTFIVFQCPQIIGLFSRQNSYRFVQTQFRSVPMDPFAPL